jgi:molecular chaperone HscB
VTTTRRLRPDATTRWRGFASASDSNHDDDRAAVCWSCAAPASSSARRFFCDACGVILPVDPAASTRDPTFYFSLLSVPARYALDLGDLEASMKTLQKALHPDKFSAKGETERAHSAAHASLVNAAYATLRDPLRRAKYILAGRGAGVAEDDGLGAGGGEGGDDTGERGTSTGADSKRLVPPELLMEVMETREAIEDAAGDADALRRLRDANDAEEAACREALARALDGEPMDLETARRVTVKMTYLARIRTEITERS